MKELEISFADDDPQIDISFAEYELQDDTKFTVATVTVIGQGTSAEFTFTSQEQSSLLSSVLTEVGVALDLTNNQGYSLQEATDLQSLIISAFQGEIPLLQEVRRRGFIQDPQYFQIFLVSFLACLS